MTTRLVSSHIDLGPTSGCKYSPQSRLLSTPGSQLTTVWLASDRKGGCAAMGRTRDFPNSNYRPLTAAHGLTSTRVPSVFPLSFCLLPTALRSLHARANNRNEALVVVVATALLFLVLRPQPIGRLRAQAREWISGLKVRHAPSPSPRSPLTSRGSACTSRVAGHNHKTGQLARQSRTYR